MNKISDHITFHEATKSQTATRHGISNFPNEKQISAMECLAENVFEPLRAFMGNKPIAITSFFRSEKLNKKIGGSSRSQHCKGEAMDIDADVFGGMTNSEIFHCIKDNLEFDQMIWEFGDDENPDWVHVSYCSDGKNRNRILKAKKEGKKTVYEIL